MREAKARIANARGKAPKPTRAVVIPPGEASLIPTAAAAPTVSDKYLKLISVKTTVIMNNGARQTTAEIRDNVVGFVTIR
jgi:hypothetical protein